MNDTKVTPRQAKILDILSQIPITRIEIAGKVSSFYPMSKATLMRELNILKDQKLVKVQGKGKNTVYASLQDSFLKYVDLDEYFNENSDIRIKGTKNFRVTILEQVRRYSNKELLITRLKENNPPYSFKQQRILLSY